MQSKVDPTYTTTYRVANWASHDRARVGRGDITLWVSPEAIDTWAPVGVGTRGGQRKCSDIAIETALTLRLLFHLPLRQAEGFLQSLFGLMGLGLEAPDHTTISRRGQRLDVRPDRVPPNKGALSTQRVPAMKPLGRRRWKQASGYHRQARRETHSSEARRSSATAFEAGAQPGRGVMPPSGARS
jgi:hypothetical protein